MDNELYQEQILDRYHQPRHRGSLEHATWRLEGANRTCGDELVMHVQRSGDSIKVIKFESRACAICTASADLLIDQLIGQPLATIDQMTAADIQQMLGLPLSPIRLKCALLPLETLKSYKPSDNT